MENPLRPRTVNTNKTLTNQDAEESAKLVLTIQLKQKSMNERPSKSAHLWQFLCTHCNALRLGQYNWKLELESTRTAGQKNLVPLYIISLRDEVLLCQEAADTIRKAASIYNITSMTFTLVADSQFELQPWMQWNQSFVSVFPLADSFDIQLIKWARSTAKA